MASKKKSVLFVCISHYKSKVGIIILLLQGIDIFLFQMTGLDVNNERIIEMACLVTDEDLNIVAEVNLNIIIISYLCDFMRVFVYHISKLHQTNIPHTIIILIANYIKGRKAYTTFRNKTSTQRQFKNGVPEGGVLRRRRPITPTLHHLHI